jgi:hypothetical protein
MVNFAGRKRQRLGTRERLATGRELEQLLLSRQRREVFRDRRGNGSALDDGFGEVFLVNQDGWVIPAGLLSSRPPSG